MTPVEAILVTGTKRQPGLLTADLATRDLLLSVLTVDGVSYAPDDLPAGAYLLVDDPGAADLAAQAGFFLEPPSTDKRRYYSFEGKLWGALLMLGAVVSLYWVVVRALELDLVSVLVWLGLAAFLGLLGLFWWLAGDQEILRRDAVNRTRARRTRHWINTFIHRR